MLKSKWNPFGLNGQAQPAPADDAPPPLPAALPPPVPITPADGKQFGLENVRRPLLLLTTLP